MNIMHNKNNDWRTELVLLDMIELIPFVDSVLKEGEEQVRKDLYDMFELGHKLGKEQGIMNKKIEIMNRYRLETI